MKIAVAVLARGVLAVAAALGTIVVVRLLSGSAQLADVLFVLALVVAGAGLEAWGRE